MTHDELLAEIDSNIQFCTCDYRYANNCWESENVPWKALLAVVETIKAYEGSDVIANEEFDQGIRSVCRVIIQAIEKELV
jgi:hypothetical protein